MEVKFLDKHVEPVGSLRSLVKTLSRHRSPAYNRRAVSTTIHLNTEHYDKTNTRDEVLGKQLTDPLQIDAVIMRSALRVTLYLHQYSASRKTTVSHSGVLLPINNVL